MQKTHVAITAVGGYVPDYILTNQMLETMVDTTDEWIVTRTGIKERRILKGEGLGSSDMGAEAVKDLCKKRGIDPNEIDCVICATVTPDMVFPATANIIADKVGINNAFSFDIGAACSGFLFALTTGASLIESGRYKKVIVVGVDKMSSILDYSDRTTCIIFGDGAGAVVLEGCEHDGSGPGILATDIHADGKHTGILCVPGTVSGGQVLGDPTLKMDGQAVFKLAVGVLEDAARAVLAKAGKTAADVDWLVPHQANIRIMQGTARKLKLPMSKVVVTVDQHGNTSAASIPLALDHAVRSGSVLPGQIVMLEGVGGGFTWGAALLRM